METKYIKFRRKDAKDEYDDFIIVFSAIQQHRDIAEVFADNYTPISAGFIGSFGKEYCKEPEAFSPYAYGNSESLHLDSDPEKDTKILKRLLRFGE